MRFSYPDLTRSFHFGQLTAHFSLRSMGIFCWCVPEGAWFTLFVGRGSKKHIFHVHRHTCECISHDILFYRFFFAIFTPCDRDPVTSHHISSFYDLMSVFYLYMYYMYYIFTLELQLHRYYPVVPGQYNTTSTVEPVVLVYSHSKL